MKLKEIVLHEVNDRLAKRGPGSKADLARHMKCRPSQVTTLISGARPITVCMVEALAEFLKCEPFELMGYTKRSIRKREGFHRG